MSVRFIRALVFALALSAPAHAATIYDEADMGDAAPTGILLGPLDQIPTANSVNLGILPVGTHGLVGSVLGGGFGDNYDAYTFVALAPFQINLTFYEAGGNNSSSNFYLTRGAAQFLHPVVAQARLSAPADDLFGGVGTGRYVLTIGEVDSTSPTRYGLDIVVGAGVTGPQPVPAPATALLLGSALGLVLIRRRRG